MPLVSIITPAYNGVAYIAETIESVRAQTFDDWEHLITDDCSTDATFDVIREFAARDPRIKPLRNERNAGPATARNLGLASARGRFIAFIDSDDLWAPTKLEEQLAFQREQQAPITFTAYSRIDENGQSIGRASAIPPRIDYGQILKETAIATSTAMVDRERTGDFRMKKTYYDDFALWLELMGQRGAWAAGLPRELMLYRVRRGSVSRNRLNSLRQMWNTYYRVEKLPLPQAAWYFTHYVINGVRKHRQQGLI